MIATDADRAESVLAQGARLSSQGTEQHVVTEPSRDDVDNVPITCLA